MTGREKRSRGSWWAGEGMRQSMSIYQRFSGEKCKQFSWIGFPSKPEPQEAVKIELGRVGEGGGRRAEAYTCPVPDSSLLWSLEHGGIDFKVGRVCNALIMYWSFTAQCLWWGWRINLLFAVLKIQTAQLQKCRLKKGALGKEKQCLADVASIVCFPSAEGGKKWEDHLMRSESLSVMTVVIFVMWLPFWPFQVSAYVNSFNWVVTSEWVCTWQTRSPPSSYSWY